MADLPPWIVLNATNLATGKAWKFFHDRMGDYLIGATDRTADVRLADAVAASAAYPGLVDPLPLALRWEDLRPDLLDGRWERPDTAPRETSRWRKRFRRGGGQVVVPLVDGGVYDNEGRNSLRGAGLTHIILSSVAPPEGDRGWRRGPGALLRTIDVMHARLGAVTRQLAHEATHGAHPSLARGAAREAAQQLRALAASGGDLLDNVLSVAEKLDAISAVGWPPRGRQFRATAPILLHRTDVAENRSATYAEGAFDIPSEDRGLRSSLVEEFSRVRTDLDALGPGVFDLLVAQGYYLADAHIKIAMPDVLAECAGARGQTAPELRPGWEWARHVVAAANGNEAETISMLAGAARRRWLVGRCATRREAARLSSGILLAAGVAFAVAAGIVRLIAAFICC